MSLPDDTRARIIAMDAQRYSYTEIAERLHISRNSVAGALFRHRHNGAKSIGTGKKMPARALLVWPFVIQKSA